MNPVVHITKPQVRTPIVTSRTDNDVFTWVPSAPPGTARRPLSPPEARCMTQLHFDRLLAERPAPVPGTETPAAAPSSRRLPATETSIQTVPTPRTGDVQPSEDNPPTT